MVFHDLGKAITIPVIADMGAGHVLVPDGEFELEIGDGLVCLFGEQPFPAGMLRRRVLADAVFQATAGLASISLVLWSWLCLIFAVLVILVVLHVALPLVVFRSLLRNHIVTRSTHGSELKRRLRLRRIFGL